MTITQNILKASLFTPGSRGWGLPMLFWGDPGIGKSDMIEELGASFGMHVEVLSPGERGEGAFGVTPVPIKSKSDLESWVMSYPKPSWTDSFEDSDDCGIVFVDELTTAPPALQPALLGLVQARRIGSHYLGSRIRVIGAANPPAIAAGGWDLRPPVANRFGHAEWAKPSAEDWIDWLMTHDALAKPKLKITPARKEEDRVIEAWPVAYASAKGLVAGFIQRRPELLHKMPPKGDPTGSRAWPSHRSWDMATRALASSSVHGLSDMETDVFVQSFIGIGAMTEFAAYRAAADLPNPADLLDGKLRWEHEPERLDRTMAVFSACTALVVNDQSDLKAKRVDAIWKLLATAMNDAQDLVVMTLKPLAKARLHTGKTAIPVMAKLKPILDAAGA